MFRFVEFHYTNALFLYRRLDGVGEQFRATGACIFYSFGVLLFFFSTIDRLTGSLALLWHQWVPVIYKPGFADFLLSLLAALGLNYFWLWRRAPILEERYAYLKEENRRWLAGLGFFLSVGFMLACGYGLVNYFGSLAIVGLLLAAQEIIFHAVRKKLGETR